MVVFNRLGFFVILSCGLPVFYDFLKLELVPYSGGFILPFADKSLFVSYHRRFLSIYNGFVYGFFSRIALKGVGFRCWVVGSNLLFDIGFNHFVYYLLPPGIVAESRKGVLILFSGDCSLLNSVSSRIVSLRKPDPYKGKGLVWAGRPTVLKVRKRKLR